jgi:hypothetical protein
MTKNEHELVHAEDAGNGYHGRCKHCGLPLVTDLGYDSWAGVKCVDREITYDGDIPKEIKAYAEFRGYRWDNKIHVFVKPSFSEKLDHVTLNKMHEKVIELQLLEIFDEQNKPKN